MSLIDIIHALKSWYSEFIYQDKVYGLTKEVFNAGKSVKIYAEELWWEDYISCNWYETKTDNYLRPCEMPASKVEHFLRHIVPCTYESLDIDQWTMYMPNTDTKKTIIIWLGCFRWVQAMFDTLDGVLTTEVGYAGGTTPLPNYDHISDYTEAVKVIYNPQLLSLEQLFDTIAQYKDLWFKSHKNQYKYAIRYMDDNDKKLLQYKRQQLQEQSQRTILLEILPHTHFERAEEYHQKYFFKHNIQSPSCAY